MKFEDVVKAKEEYKKSTKQNILYITISIAIFICLFIIGSALPVDSALSYILGFLCILAFFGIFFAIYYPLKSYQESRKKYQAAYKTYFVEKNLANTFTDLQYNHDAGLTREVLVATQMVNTGDRYSSNDLTTGKYKDVAFTQADVNIEEEHTDSDGHTYYSTLFKGRFMIYEFPKKFNFRLMVIEKGFRAARIPRKNSKTGREFKKISLESSELNNMFKIYAEDDFEAFYLLDPDFIGNILELNSEHSGQIMLGFLDNKLLVGLKDGKDAFEAPGAFKDLVEVNEAAKVAREINLITNFIDKLKLDHKLFKS